MNRFFVNLGALVLGGKVLRKSSLELGTWNLELEIWNLKFGTWNLEFGTWNLEFGIWNFIVPLFSSPSNSPAVYLL